MRMSMRLTDGRTIDKSRGESSQGTFTSLRLGNGSPHNNGTTTNARLTMTDTLQQTQSGSLATMGDAKSTLVERASDVGSSLNDETRAVAREAKDHARQMVHESR